MFYIYCMGMFLYFLDDQGGIMFEPAHEKTNTLGFRPGPTQTRLYGHSIKLEA